MIAAHKRARGDRSLCTHPPPSRQPGPALRVSAPAPFPVALSSEGLIHSSRPRGHPDRPSLPRFLGLDRLTGLHVRPSLVVCHGQAFLREGLSLSTRKSSKKRSGERRQGTLESENPPGLLFSHSSVHDVIFLLVHFSSRKRPSRSTGLCRATGSDGGKLIW